MKKVILVCLMCAMYVCAKAGGLFEAKKSLVQDNAIEVISTPVVENEQIAAPVNGPIQEISGYVVIVTLLGYSVLMCYHKIDKNKEIDE